MRRNIGGTIADIRGASHALRIPHQTFGTRLTSDSTTATDEKSGYLVVRVAAEDRLPRTGGGDGGVADAAALLRGLASAFDSVVVSIGGGRGSVNVALGNGRAEGALVTST